MNPFDLPGPAFLGFYAVLIVVLFVVAHAVRRAIEDGPTPKLEQVDPYLVAYLRGGENEALRVAIIALVDRGLLIAQGDLLIAAPGAVERVRRPIERRILEGFGEAAQAHRIFGKREARRACEPLASELAARGLIPNANQTLLRLALGAVVVGVLWWVAHTKMDIAIQRGRRNIGLLAVLALFAPVLTYWVLRARRTPIGDRLLEDLRMLFAGLRGRVGEIRTGGATNELALLCGVYGLGVLPGSVHAQAQALFPLGSASESATWGGACGTSCGSDPGSSSGSSCGSSCGGGGGGGCGGCGS